MKQKEIILIGNYPPDRQESMERFARMLVGEYESHGHATKIWRPKPILVGAKAITTKGAAKWLGYLDKWILYPVLLAVKSRLKNNAVFHVCDHSNAPYLSVLPRKRTLITCHDVLAIRGALGFKDAYCEASGMGKLLQKYILYYLSRSRKTACVSQFTLNQLTELSSGVSASANRRWEVVYNAFNAHFYQMTKAEKQKDSHLPTHGKRFLFHVGSNLERKNRAAIVHMLHLLRNDYPELYLCFAGHTADEKLSELVTTLGLTERVINLHRPSAEDLLLLYNTCEAFVFPSFSEGFGWPIIEAQACGVPVITSSLNPMQEVSGQQALYASPNNPQEFADAFRRLDDADVNKSVVNGGLDNIKRFTNEEMTRKYLNLLNTKN